MSDAREPSDGAVHVDDAADERTGEHGEPASDEFGPSAGDGIGEHSSDERPSDKQAGGEEAGGEEAGGEEAGKAAEPGGQSLELEGEIAADYVEGLLDIVDYDGDIDMDVEGDRAIVSVVGIRDRVLVGQQGEVLDALQELTRLAVHQKTGVRSRLMLDIGGYRARRREELTKLGRDVAEEVERTGEEQSLEPMTPFERKVVHDAVAAAGLRSESEGEEPERYVVILPAS